MVAHHKYTKQQIILISPSEELRKSAIQLQSMQVPKKDIAVLSPQMGCDPTQFWKISPGSDEDPNLVARPQIDSLKIQCQTIKRDFSRAIEIIKNPHRATPEIMDYLKHSVRNSRFFHAFLEISIETHKISEHAMRSSSTLDARIFLFGAQNIPSCLPDISCLEADIEVGQGANEIDEACLLAILTQSTKRLMLIKEDPKKLLDCIHPNNIEDLVLDSSRKTLWDRLVAGGFIVIKTLTKNVDLDDGQTDEEPEVEEASSQLDPLQDSEALKSLQKMVGLDDVKERVRHLHRQAKMKAQRMSIGQPIRTISLNGTLKGPLGTGKTTFGTLYGRILNDIGLLPRDDIIRETESGLIGKDIGETAERVQNAIHEAEGNVLINDDAYTLWGGGKNPNPLHKAAIDTLVNCVSESRTSSQCILLVVYEYELREMFRHVNPAHLDQIMNFRKKEVRVSCFPEASEVAIEMIRHALVSPRFPNARHVEQIVVNAQLSCQRRYLSDSSMDPTVLTVEDFSKVWNRVLDVEEEYRKLSSSVTGCGSFVEQLLDDIRIANPTIIGNLDSRERIPVIYIFRGAPGTSKASTARRMGEIFHHMRFFATPEVIEYSVADLVGEYSGDTGLKVLDLFDRALGKVLLLDKVHLLVENDQSLKEVVGELVGAMTSPRFGHNMFIILAGYGQGMDSLLSSNPGLNVESNVSWHLTVCLGGRQ
ncbi:hypothetical protein ASPFODRAFT_75378 [Aspergillus luchuensis CBS 106.47]|uniref:ATPase AAA-type core domain-containing protein n=1 Tax=Aspergillus luchuensis (strain CBS 106.47) TaxID=1137211 RepID=A0A1M3T3H6_ASPLC|nr:hypothetical protein ASPFODRAFT_75378 [Aspergillus luchuensis CBS 106.47]